MNYGHDPLTFYNSIYTFWFKTISIDVKITFTFLLVHAFYGNPNDFGVQYFCHNFERYNKFKKIADVLLSNAKTFIHF